jgi:hypothetical protein
VPVRSLALVALLILAECTLAFPIHDDKPVEEDASLDSSVDAPRDGQNGPADASADGPTGGRFCSGRDAAGTLFCDDFDDPGRTSVNATGWQPIFNHPIGSIVSQPVFSPPSALGLRYGADAGTGRAGAVRIVSFPLSATHLIVSARAFETGGSTAGGIDLGQLTVCWFAWRQLLGGSVYAYCAGQAVAVVQVAPAIVPNSWNAVVFEISRQATGLHLKVQVGDGSGAVTGEGDFVTDAGSAAFSAQAQVVLGNIESDETGSIYFDDVVAEVY